VVTQNLLGNHHPRRSEVDTGNMVIGDTGRNILAVCGDE
jgi:hypothetical protein